VLDDQHHPNIPASLASSPENNPGSFSVFSATLLAPEKLGAANERGVGVKDTWGRDIRPDLHQLTLLGLSFPIYKIIDLVMR
jgi:hypothetical protein